MRHPRLRKSGGAAALLVLLALACGRGTVEKSSAAAPRPTARPEAASDVRDAATRRKRPPGGRVPVIWLGLDGLDFELVDRLAAEGRMPNWKRFAAEGFTARLKSYMPILSPIVWTTLSTGVGPDVHRVLDFQEVDPGTGQRVPISGRSRAVPAIWNVASEAGLSVGVVGWWATHPAEEVKGFFVSDRASPILFEGLPLQGVAYPASLSAGVEQIIAREAPVGDAELARFVVMPLAEIASHRARAKGLQDPIVALARTIGATRVESRIGRELYDRNLPDLTMLYFEGTDVIGHLFASYVPPKMTCVSDDDVARYGRAVDEYYALVDRILGQWMRRAEEDGATLIINSDHGFKWGDDRSCEQGSLNPETAGFWHRLDGVFAAWGARVRRGPTRGSASVFDVPVTVSALLGLPVDRRAAGTPIRAAFEKLPALERRDLAAVAVRRLETSGLSEQEASEYAKKLMALGYLSGSEPGRLAPSGGDRPGLTESAWNNLGLYLCGNPGRVDLAAAEAAYKKSLELRPDYATAMTNLAALYLLKGDDRQAIEWLFRSLAAGSPNPDDAILDWAARYQARAKRREAREVLERGVRAYPDSEAVSRALALDDYTARRCPAADQVLGRFEPATQNADTLNALALIRACLGRRDDAVRLFHRSLAVKPDQPTVVQSLAVLEGAPASGRRQGQ
jgi:Flp pilus assembly protein TadD